MLLIQIKPWLAGWLADGPIRGGGGGGVVYAESAQCTGGDASRVSYFDPYPHHPSTFEYIFVLYSLFGGQTR